ncbi:DUF1542 domain-containing protein, partial [Lactobacillus gallinarum]|uniref:DUF1542 domain-containing protein n=1 Tax=Lactobacillus gallinarum TaxID=52242 RepID=UPI0019572D14
KDVATEQTKGTQAIDAVKLTSLTDSQTAAKAAIDKAAKTKDEAIEASNLTAEEKADLKQKVADEVQKDKAAIAAATKDADVNTAQTNGERAINAVEIPTSSKTKNDANSDLDKTADAAKNAIDETSGLTDDQKQTAKDQIDKAVDAAKENIKKASDNTGVADATDAGKLAIDKVSAKAAIDQALNKKTSEINGANNLDQTTKDKLLQDATDAADAAKNAIGQATTADAIKKAQDDGVSNVNNVKVPSLEDAKQAAKDAVDQAAGKQTDLINKSNNLSDSEKQ